MFGVLTRTHISHTHRWPAATHQPACRHLCSAPAEAKLHSSPSLHLSSNVDALQLLNRSAEYWHRGLVTVWLTAAKACASWTFADKGRQRSGYGCEGEGL